MALTPGSAVGRYEIRTLLGSGGMGEVYKAHDPTLGRAVALKVLRADLSSGTAAGEAGRLTRFLQEARAASALNHPNILTIHEVGEHEGARFIVSEFVEGATVRDRVARGPLTLREVLDITIQTSSALAAAHAAGIVHRDIKPENLMLRPDGYVKVLDFGVARLVQKSGAPDSGDAAATMAPRETTAGMVVGTLAYMAPEQARGLEVDARADGFSLGVVLYELVTGRPPFTGPTPSDVMVAILDKEPPPIRQHVRGLPLQLEWMVTKALDKDPNLRYQSMADLRVDLLRLKHALDAGKLVEGAAVGDVAPAQDEAIEVELTEDSAPVRALSAWSRVTLALAVPAAALLVAALILYDQARIGASLPLQLPEGAAVTKARDAIQALGQSGWGSLAATNFDGALDVRTVVRLAGLDQARQAVRDGVVADWDVGLTHTRNPAGLSGGNTPEEGDFSVRLNPRGELAGFATGVSKTAVALPERERAIALGVDAVRRAFKVDASGFDLEYIPRSFPASTVEMTWRNPARRYGHIEQFRVDLQGERLVRLDRSFVEPPNEAAPADNPITSGFRVTGPIVIVVAFLAAWGFGLWVLVKAKSWDAVKHRLPLAVCGILLASAALSAFDETMWEGLVAVAALAVMIGGVLLPPLSGVFLWMRRRSPARIWTADQLARGRVLGGAVGAALVAGVAAAAAIAGVLVVTDLAALQVEGFLPSISNELEAVDKGLPSVITDAVTLASMLGVGIALAVEALERARLKPLVVTAIVAVVGALTVGADQRSLVASIVPGLGMAVAAAIAVTVYRTRGLLAVWAAAVATALLMDGLALRSLDDPGRVSVSNLVFGLVALLLALGVWGAGSSKFKVHSSQF